MTFFFLLLFGLVEWRFIITFFFLPRTIFLRMSSRSVAKLLICIKLMLSDKDSYFKAICARCVNSASLFLFYQQERKMQQLLFLAKKCEDFLKPIFCYTMQNPDCSNTMRWFHAFYAVPLYARHSMWNDCTPGIPLEWTIFSPEEKLTTSFQLLSPLKACLRFN